MILAPRTFACKMQQVSGWGNCIRCWASAPGGPDMHDSGLWSKVLEGPRVVVPFPQMNVIIVTVGVSLCLHNCFPGSIKTPLLCAAIPTPDLEATWQRILSRCKSHLEYHYRMESRQVCLNAAGKKNVKMAASRLWSIHAKSWPYHPHPHPFLKKKMNACKKAKFGCSLSGKINGFFRYVAVISELLEIKFPADSSQGILSMQIASKTKQISTVCSPPKDFSS